ncbi:hypothetical protein [Myroides sp. N17-2]|uniref:hypothetical protein n=1 Tax=Myroides sp. N17-2 TaxID=2030799 RepID=UPI000EFA8683|nr:hypothetical protein [Myroides sp. N17-2]
MKKTTILIILGLGLFIFGLASCSDKRLTKGEIIKKNVEVYLKEKMNDPSSYEFVKLELIDSITFSNNIEYRKDYFTRNIGYDKSSLERQEGYKTEIPSMYDEKEVENLKTKIRRNEVILSKIDSLATILGNKKYEVASYTYFFSFRGNNALGVKILNEYIVQTNPAPDFEIINITDNKDKIILNPNDFPGYREMMEKNL